MIKNLFKLFTKQAHPKIEPKAPQAFDEFLALSKMQGEFDTYNFKNPFKLTQEQQNEIIKANFPTPKLKDQKGRNYAMDASSRYMFNAQSLVTDSGRNDDRIFDFYASHGFIGWQLCAIIYQNWLVANACNVPVEDALRPLWNTPIKRVDGEEEDAKLSTQLNERLLKRYQLASKLRKHAVNMKQFGVSYAMLCFEEGHDYTLPFNLDGVMPGSFRGIAVVDPYWVMPNWNASNLSNPTNPDFYEPEFYTIQGNTRIHKSYICKIINQEVADIIKPSYYFGGVPLTQQIYERIYAAERTANEAPLLALTKRLLVIPTNLKAMIANPKIAWDMVKMLVMNRDNQGVYFTEEGERAQVHQVDTSLSDMDATIMSQYQLVASIARIPAHKLLKTDPKGLNNNGDYSIKDYVQELQSLQEKAFRPLIERVCEIILRSDFGLQGIEASVEFNPIDMPSEEDKARVEQMEAQTATTYIQAGVLSPEEVRNVLRAEKNGKYANIAPELPAVELPEDVLNTEEEKNDNGTKE